MRVLGPSFTSKRTKACLQNLTFADITSPFNLFAKKLYFLSQQQGRRKHSDCLYSSSNYLSRRTVEERDVGLFENSCNTTNCEDNVGVDNSYNNPYRRQGPLEEVWESESYLDERLNLVREREEIYSERYLGIYLDSFSEKYVESYSKHYEEEIIGHVNHVESLRQISSLNSREGEHSTSYSEVTTSYVTNPTSDVSSFHSDTHFEHRFSRSNEVDSVITRSLVTSERWSRLGQGNVPSSLGQKPNKPWQRTIGGVLDGGMRSGMVPSRVYHPRGPLAAASGALLTDDVTHVTPSLSESSSKVWRRRGLGRNKVLPGPTWSTRMLKLARIEATKVERERERVTAEETAFTALGLHAKVPSVIGGGGGDTSDFGALYRILQAQRFSERAEQIFKWAKQQPGYVADARTYSELTRIMAWGGEADVAKELLTEMWFRDLVVDPVTLFAVLAAYAKSNRYFETIQLYKESTRTWQVAEHDACFALFLWANAQVGQGERALSAVEEREQSQWALEGDPLRLQKNLALLEASGVNPGVKDVVKLVQAIFCKSNSQHYTHRIKELYQKGEKGQAGEMATFILQYWNVPYWLWREQLDYLLGRGEGERGEDSGPGMERDMEDIFLSRLFFSGEGEEIAESGKSEVEEQGSVDPWKSGTDGPNFEVKDETYEKEGDTLGFQMTTFWGQTWRPRWLSRRSTSTLSSPTFSTEVKNCNLSNANGIPG